MEDIICFLEIEVEIEIISVTFLYPLWDLGLFSKKDRFLDFSFLGLPLLYLFSYQKGFCREKVAEASYKVFSFGQFVKVIVLTLVDNYGAKL